MPEPQNPERLAALRRRIEQAGGSTSECRTGLTLLLTAPVAAFCLPGILVLGQNVHAALAACAILVAWSGCAYVMAAPFARLYRRRIRARLHRRLLDLTEADRAAVLLPLRHSDSADTRALVAPLIDELCAQTPELSPSAPPDGGGAELTVHSAPRGSASPGLPSFPKLPGPEAVTSRRPGPDPESRGQ